MSESIVKVNFIQRSNGTAADVKVEAAEGVTTEELERIANLAYDTALATYNKASTFTQLKQLN